MAVSTAARAWLRRFLSARLDPTAYLGLHLSIGLAVTALGLWVFGALLDMVLDNATMVRWDIATVKAIHEAMTPALLRIGLAATQLGSPVAMAALMVIGAIALWIAGRRTLLIGWAAAFVGGAILDELLKLTVRRDRPVYGTAFLHGHSYSFPSGHSMGALIGYGMLVWLIGQLWHLSRRARVTVYTLAALLILAVGLSRMILGVHYPSDVLGGYAAGAAWMAVCVTGVHLASHRRTVREQLAAIASSVQPGSTPP